MTRRLGVADLSGAVMEVRPHSKNIEWRVVTVAKRGDFVVFAGKLADALEKGKPLPQGTTEEPPKFEGALPSLRLPRAGGGGGQAAWRNTKEGFLAEQNGRQRWQQVEEERKDRRTAAMTAFERFSAIELMEMGTKHVIVIANEIYEWLRTSPAAGPAGSAPQTGPVSAGVATRGEGHGSEPTGTSPAGGTTSGGPKPDSGYGEGPGTEGPPETVAASDAAGDAKPGSGDPPPSRQTTVSPGPGFPIAEADCNHKGPSGRWLPTKVIDGLARCPRCGASALKFRETA
jgi:hypothetical protein